MDNKKDFFDFSRREFLKKTAASLGGVGIILAENRKSSPVKFLEPYLSMDDLPPCNPDLLDWDGRPELPFHSDPLYYFSKGDGKPGILAEHIIKSGLLKPFTEEDRKKKIDFAKATANFPGEKPVYLASLEYNDGTNTSINKMIIKLWADQGYYPDNQDARRMYHYPCCAFKLLVTDRRTDVDTKAQFYTVDVIPMHVVHPTIPDFIVFGVRTDEVSQRIQPNDEKRLQLFEYDHIQAAKEERFTWPYPMYLWDFDKVLLKKHKAEFYKSPISNFLPDLVLNLDLDKATDAGKRLSNAFDYLKTNGFFPEDMNDFCVPIDLMPRPPKLKTSMLPWNNRNNLSFI